ncbi:transposase, partial [Vibrio mimicus]
MPKPRYKTNNWKQYNQALINRGSLTFWIDEEAIREWKVKKHGPDGKLRVWRKLHLVVDTSTHEIIAAELSLSTVSEAEVLPNLLKQTRRKILE